MSDVNSQQTPEQELRDLLSSVTSAKESLETERTQAQEALAKLVAEKAKSKVADKPIG
jgi:hypothetical protein